MGQAVVCVWDRMRRGTVAMARCGAANAILVIADLMGRGDSAEANDAPLRRLVPTFYSSY